MSAEYRLGGVLLTDRVELIDGTSGFCDAAERGAIGTGGVTIEDRAGTLTFNGYATFTVDDTEATPTRVWTGVAVDRNIGRLGRNVTTTARSYDCTLLDLNELMHRHVIHANDGKRPAETDLVRIAWLLASYGLTGLVIDAGLVATTGAINFLASDTRRTYSDDVLSEMAPIAGRNFYVYRDNASGNAALAYRKDSETYWAATSSVSNVASEVNGTTVFAPSHDAVVNRQPDASVYTGISYGWQGDPIYATSAATAAAFGITRDAVFDTNRVGLLATAQSEATRWLNQHSGETDVVTLTLTLPSSKVNTIYAGQELNVKLTHVPGYTAGVVTRVRRRTVKPIAPSVWEMRLELWVPPTPATDATTTICVTPTELNVAHGTMSADARNNIGSWPTPANINDGNDGTNTGHTAGYCGYPCTQTDMIRATFDVPLTVKKLEVLHTSGGPWTSDEVVQYSDDGTTWSNAPGAWEGFGSTERSANWRTWGKRYVLTTPIVAQYWAVGRFEIYVAGIGYYLDKHVATLDVFGCIAAETPLPHTGAAVYNETAGGTVNGSNTNFTTAHGWIAGSLRVYHDGFDQTPHVSASDPVAGTFTLDYAPSYGSLITAYYTAA